MSRFLRLLSMDQHPRVTLHHRTGSVPLWRKGRFAASYAAVALATIVAHVANAEPAPPDLAAAPGVTALSGRVVDPNGRGLGRVRIVDNATTTYTDDQGRYILAPVVVGKSIIQIDGRHIPAESGKDYGIHEVQGIAKPGVTTELEFTSWLTPIDHDHDVAVGAPTVGEVVIRTPAIPDLELHIPAGMVVRDIEGKPVDHVSITSLQVSKQVVPLPPGVGMPLAFTIQPGAACLYSRGGGIGYARIVYPNIMHRLPRARLAFWRYEPDANGWRIYGAGTVSDDGRQVLPDRDTVITDFGSGECDPHTRSRLLVIEKPQSVPGAQQ